MRIFLLLSAFAATSGTTAELTQEEQKFLLKVHNGARAKFAVPPLVWSEHLAQVASEHADGWGTQGLANNDRHRAYAKLAQIPDAQGVLVGENMALGADYRPRADSRFEPFFQLWINAAPRYVCGADTDPHYGQVIAWGTKLIGCGRGRSRVGISLYCNYFPALDVRRPPIPRERCSRPAAPATIASDLGPMKAEDRSPEPFLRDEDAPFTPELESDPHGQ